MFVMWLLALLFWLPSFSHFPMENFFGWSSTSTLGIWKTKLAHLIKFTLCTKFDNIRYPFWSLLVLSDSACGFSENKTVKKKIKI